MHYPKTLICASLLASASIASAQTQTSEKTSENGIPIPKHVILIVADDLGYGDLSCYGNTTFKTPNIDALLQHGVKFNRAYSSSATCTPARYSMFTGENAFRQKGTGILPGDANMIIKPGRETLATVFQKNGYKTAAIGKWHLGLGVGGKIDWNKTLNASPNDIGFDYSYVQAATNDRVPCVFVKNRDVENLDPNDPIQVSYGKKIGNEPTGKENPELLKLKHSHGHDNTIINGIGRIGFMTGGKSARWVDEYMADSFVLQTTQFIDENSKNNFFIYHGSPDPHVPRTPHPRFVGKSGLGARGDAILQFDDNVGTIIAHLKKRGIYDDTMIILTSDNGPVLDDGYVDSAWELNNKLGHKPWGQTIRGNKWGGKYGILEAGTRIPFMVSYPKMNVKNKTSDALVAQCDVMGSFLAQFKMKPTQTMPDLTNQWDALTGKTTQGRDYLMVDAFDGQAVITPEWKYTQPKGKNAKPELYNLQSDSFERSNQIETQPELAKKLAEIYKKGILPITENIK